MTSLRQIEANQRNAKLSTGPRTEEGKRASRRNAVKHGLAGAGVVLPQAEAEAVANRNAEWNSSLRPWNVFEIFLAEQIVVASIQVERCQHEQRNVRAVQANRAAECWDDDRRLAAERLAEKLPKRPGVVSRELRRTKQGCALLIERWEALGQIFEDKGKWTEPQRNLALDLLGVLPELREGRTKLDANPAEVMAAELAMLKSRMETALDDLDIDEQAAAEMGLESAMSEDLRRFRRYESACHRRLQWALKELRRQHRGGKEAYLPHVPKTIGIAPEAEAEPETEERYDPTVKEMSVEEWAEFTSRNQPRPATSASSSYVNISASSSRYNS